jgi:hypothetical protein
VPKDKRQKATDHKQHMKLQKEKELKRKERRNTQLPAGYTKGKK